jgi:WXG100 family type VII secretion target
MSSKFTVDLEELDKIVARLSGLAGFLHDHLDELDRRVAALSGGSWDSAAARAYADAHARWLSSAREFADGVAKISDAAQQAHGRYTTAISTNHGILRSGQA